MINSFMKTEKEPTTVIDVAKKLTSIIGSRDIVDFLKKSILEAKTKSVVLDFKNVQFISRSAAHQLLLTKEEVHYHKKELSFINTNEEVSEMLRTIAANRALPNPRVPEFKAKIVDIDSLLERV